MSSASLIHSHAKKTANSQQHPLYPYFLKQHEDDVKRRRVTASSITTIKGSGIMMMRPKRTPKGAYKLMRMNAKKQPLHICVKKGSPSFPSPSPPPEFLLMEAEEERKEKQEVKKMDEEEDEPELVRIAHGNKKEVKSG